MNQPQTPIVSYARLITKNVEYSIPFLECVIVEAINSEFMFGHLAIRDANAITQLLNGEELIEIGFSTTLADQRMNKQFAVYSKTPETIEINGQRAYKILFVSPEALRAGGITLCQKYDMPIGDIVGSILSSVVIPSSDKQIDCDRNTPRYQFIAPNVKAIDALKMLREKAVSSTGMPYVLFENAVGFNFASLNTLFDNYNTKDVFLYSSTNTITGKNTRSDAARAIAVDRVQVFSNFDTIDLLNRGGFSTTIGQYDLLNKQYQKTKTIMPSQNQFNYSPYSSTFLNQIAGDDTQTSYEFVPIYQSYDQHFASNKGMRNIQYNIINNYSIQFAQSQATYMHRAGECIHLDFDRHLTITDQGTGEPVPNRKMNGRFLISKVIHVLSTVPGIRYSCLVEATKAGSEINIE